MRRYFLLSIRPEYSGRIFEGEKRFELRKRSLGIRRGDVVVVYTSSPTQALNGAFVALGELELPVETMWRRYRKDLGIGRRAYAAYFAGSDIAVAIPVGKAVKLPAISLRQLRRIRRGFTPPQSYMYCPNPLRTRLPRAWRKLLGPKVMSSSRSTTD